MKKNISRCLFLYLAISSFALANYSSTVEPLYWSTPSQDRAKLASMGFYFGSAEEYERLSNVVNSGAVCQISDIYSSENKEIFNYDITIQNNLGAFKNLPQDCVKKFLKNYIAHKEYFKKDELEKHCASHPIECESFSVIPNIYKENILSLLDLVDEHKSYLALCEEKNTSFDWTQIRALYKRAKQFEYCQDLSLGDKRVISPDPGGIREGYALEKIGDKKFKISFQVNFVTTDSSNVSPVDLKKRVDNCMERVNKVAEGPDGNKFELSVLTRDEALLVDKSERPPLVDIEIAKAGARSNSGAYASDIDCGTILHELLHLTGLVDEYAEKKRGFYVHPHTGEVVSGATPEVISNQQLKFEPLYNSCRSMAQTQSIMASSDGALDFSESNPKICECDSDPKLLGQCQDSFERGGRVQELFLESRIHITDIFKDFDKYCTKLESAKPKFDYYKSQEELMNKRSIADYTKFQNGRSFSRYSYIGSYTGGDIAWSHRNKMTCACDETRPDCMKFLNALDQVGEASDPINISSCPYGTLSVPVNNIENSSLKPNQAFIKNLKPIKLFRDSHVKYILRPECDSAAPVYTECSKYAYKERAKDCPDRPAYCSDESLWLGK